MKIVNALKLDKYSDTGRYTQREGFVYRDATGGIAGGMGLVAGPVYCVALYARLEEGEDSRYPLEDLLDRYLVNCTEVLKEGEEDGQRMLTMELESESEEAIRTVAGLVGRRVYNYTEGDAVRLGIE